MTSSSSRLLPDEQLPPYTFVPGRSPHPQSDPAGHSFGKKHSAPAPLALGCWQDNLDYLRAIDLFNHGYYWEAHEAWEGLWHAAGRRGKTATFLKGLIQLAVAGVKHLEGRGSGVATHARRAAELWREVIDVQSAEGAEFLGMRIVSLIDLADTIGRDRWPDMPPQLVPNFTQRS